MVPPLATSFIDRHHALIIAVAVVVGAVVLLAIVDRVLKRWSARVTDRLTGGQEFSRATATRLTFGRRVVEALIIAVAVAIALAEFDALDALGTAILTSSAITAAVLGFAARQTLANGIAGMMIAVAQPVRIGDLVTVEGQTGTVEDIGLVYTWLRTGGDARVLVPNERLATAIVRNDTVRSASVSAEATVWTPLDADSDLALQALQDAGLHGRICGVTAEGIEFVLLGPTVDPQDRLKIEADLRAAALGALRNAGVR